MLTVSHLCKSFPDLNVLENFSLTVPRNGFTALVGPSGCGKSTFFDVLTGVENKDSGDIRWLGESMANLGKKAAYMQQKDLLLPWLSLLDNALLPTRIQGGNRRESREKALAHFQRLGLGGFENYTPQKVSGGMRQRCALVRTLMFETELVLLDEPLSALDAITRRSLQSLLLLLQSEFKKTILMITHDVEEALLLADEVFVLSQLPMQVRECFVPSIPKPRKGSDPELIRIKEHILEELQGEL
ncbi:MAG: ABC transporter ATP-binding protein [Deltaproteobacteria bacterium]|nr:ABC transporter ATP-binding protein [Deltaproteobacteria bacterium]